MIVFLFQTFKAFFALFRYFTKGDPNLTMKDFFFIKKLKALSVLQLAHSSNFRSQFLKIHLLAPMK
jgi:hypothetical protein